MVDNISSSPLNESRVKIIINNIVESAKLKY